MEDKPKDPSRTVPITERADPDSLPTQITPSFEQHSARTLPEGALIADRYRVLGTLGSGGMGVVYRVHDTVLDVDLALKMMLPDVALKDGFSQRFRNELLLARQVSHRNVVRNHDLGVHDGSYFMTMDLVEGRSLASVLREEGPVATPRAVAWTRQIAAALAEAHRRGIVHRDLKPPNVLIDNNDEAFVTDFGVARSLGGTSLTRTGEVLGTPSYLSPEQARGESVDGRSDLYTLGVILIEMLSGKLPFVGGTLYEVLAQRMQGKILSLAELGIEVTPDLARVIERMVEADPEQRYASADELVADLEAIEQGIPIEQASLRRTRPVQPGATGTRWRPGWRTLLASAAMLVLVVGGLLGLRWVERQRGSAASGAEDAETDTPPPAPVAPPRHSVAVLPLAVATTGDELAWASTGVAELLTTQLADNQSLRVVSSARVFQLLKDLGLRPERLRDEELVQIAELFQVDRLVLGHLRTLGDQAQLDLQLLDVDRPGSPINIGSEKGAEARLFELVKALGERLQSRLDVDAAQVEQELPTSSASAMQAYMEGLERLSQGDTLNATPALERAVAQDPRFLQARVRLSQAYQSLGRYDEALASAQQAVQSAAGLGSRAALEARAQEARLQGEPERAQRLLQELVRSFPNDVGALVTLAESYGEQGQFAEALSSLQRAAAVDPSAPRTWYLLGRYSIQAGDMQKAVEEYLVRALVLQNALHNAQGQAEVHNAFGVGYERLGRIDDAIRSYQQAADIRSRIGDQRGRAVTLKNLALLRLNRGEWDAAEANLRTALELDEQLGNRGGIAELEVSLGALEEERGRYDEALDHYRRSLDLRQELGDDRALAESHARIGYVYNLMGEYANALVYLDQAADLYQQTDDPLGTIDVSTSRGLVLLQRGDWQKALAAFVASLERSREISQVFTAAVAQSGLGRVAHYQGRYQAALQSYREALGTFSELGDERNRAQLQLWEAETLLAVGSYQRAAGALDSLGQSAPGNLEQQAALESLRARWHLARGEVESAAQALGDSAETAADLPASIRLEGQIVRAQVAAAAGDATRATKQLESALAESRRISNAILQLQSGEALAVVALRAGNVEQAKTTLDSTVALVERTGAYARTFRLQALLAQALQRTGADDAAAAAWREAQAELARVRDELSDAMRADFDRLPEVQQLSAGLR